MICPICRQPAAHIERHHQIPQEYGGKDMGTVDICSQCHSGLHLSANKRYRGVLGQDAFTQEVLPRAEPFIEMINIARQIHEASSSPNELKKMIINVPAQKLARLHKLKVEKGFKSLDTFMNNLIDQLLKTM